MTIYLDRLFFITCSYRILYCHFVIWVLCCSTYNTDLTKSPVMLFFPSLSLLRRHRSLSIVFYKDHHLWYCRARLKLTTIINGVLSFERSIRWPRLLTRLVELVEIGLTPIILKTAIVTENLTVAIMFKTMCYWNQNNLEWSYSP